MNLDDLLELTDLASTHQADRLITSRAGMMTWHTSDDGADGLAMPDSVEMQGGLLQIQQARTCTQSQARTDESKHKSTSPCAVGVPKVIRTCYL